MEGKGQTLLLAPRVSNVWRSNFRVWIVELLTEDAYRRPIQKF